MSLHLACQSPAPTAGFRLSPPRLPPVTMWHLASCVTGEIQAGTKRDLVQSAPCWVSWPGGGGVGGCLAVPGRGPSARLLLLPSGAVGPGSGGRASCGHAVDPIIPLIPSLKRQNPIKLFLRTPAAPDGGFFLSTPHPRTSTAPVLRQRSFWNPLPHLCALRAPCAPWALPSSLCSAPWL